MGGDHESLEPRKRPRQQRSELMRLRILDAAEIVFTRYGFATATTNRIAQWADISVGSLYQYYSSKEAILLALATRHLDAAGSEDLRLDDENPAPPLIDVVRALVRSSFENHRADPGFLRVLVEATPRSAQLMVKVNDARTQRVTRLREVLARNEEIAVDDPEIAARLVVSTLEGVVHHMLAGPDVVDPATLESEMVEMLYRYLAAKPTTRTYTRALG